MNNYIIIWWFSYPLYTGIMFSSCNDQEKLKHLYNNDDWRTAGIAYFPQRHD